MIRKILLTAIILSFLAACEPGPGSDALHSESIRLPNGRMIQAEVALTQQDLTRGLMFRESLAMDRGMLFVFPQSGKFNFWMYQCKIPLDMIWLDSGRHIVEISADTPPCRTAASDCPHFGGNEMSQYVLELAGGAAAKYGLKKGSELSF